MKGIFMNTSDIRYLPIDIKELVDSGKLLDAKKECQKRSIEATGIINAEVKRCTDSADASFAKKEYEKSIQEYIKTIGFVDPSIVLRRFMESFLSIYLIKYLVELHKQGLATKDYTELLFTHFRSSDAQGILQDFIELLKSKPQLLMECFNADAAINALISNEMMDEALTIARVVNSPEHIIHLLITHSHSYVEAARQIEQHKSESIGRRLLMDFGPTLLAQDAGTHSIIVQCARDIWNSGHGGNDLDFLKLFSKHPKCCYDFLKEAKNKTPQLSTTLVAMVIPRAAGDSEFYGLQGIANAQLAREFLRDRSLGYDAERLLLVCAEAGFVQGTIDLLEQQNRPHDVIALLLKERDGLKLMKWVMTRDVPADDWGAIFRYYVLEGGLAQISEESDCPVFTKYVIKNAAKTIPLAALVEMLSREQIEVDTVRESLLAEYTELSRSLERERAANAALAAELADVERQIEHLESGTINFQSRTCQKCGLELHNELVGFMCGHTFHEECCGRAEDGRLFCPECGDTPTPFLEDEPIDDDELGGEDLLWPAVRLLEKGILDH